MISYQEKFSKILKNSKANLDDKLVESFIVSNVEKYWEENLRIGGGVSSQAISLSWVEPRIPIAPRSDIHTYNIFGKARWCSLYLKEFHKIIQGSNVLIFVPWLKVGGADKVAKLQIDTFSRLYEKVVVVATDGVLDVKLNNVNVVDLYKYNDLVPLDVILLGLAQSIATGVKKRIHIANSEVGYKLIAKYGVTLGHNSDISINTFCNDRDIHGLPVGYMNYVSELSGKINKIFTDNKFTRKIIAMESSFPNSNIYDAKIPVEIPITIPVVSKKTYLPKKVIWASRLDIQKAPLDLLKIALLNEDIQFELYDDFVLSNVEYVDLIRTELSKVSNVKVMGRFNGVKEIDFDNAVFVYTSYWDGMPNILLEVASVGVPIISYPLNGVQAEFSSDEFTYSEEFTPESISNALRIVFNDTKKAVSKAIKSRKKIFKYYNVDFFCENNLEFFK